MHILLVDDEPIVLKSVGEFLKRAGYHVTIQDNAQSALRELKKRAIDMVIADVCMDKMNGLEFWRCVRLCHIEIPVVLFVVHGTVVAPIEAFGKGTFDYLLDPLNLEELVKVIMQVEMNLCNKNEAIAVDHF